MLINRQTDAWNAAEHLEDCLTKDGFRVTVVVEGPNLVVQVHNEQTATFNACPKTWKGFEVEAVFVGPKKRRSA